MSKETTEQIKTTTDSTTDRQADLQKNEKITCDIWSLDGEKTGNTDLPSNIFGVKIKKHIVAEVIRWQLAKRRAGTHSTLTRSDVRGTTKKCKPQKEQGTRHGDKRAPIFRKGGIAHGPKPRDYEYSLNKKVKAMSLKIALTDRLASGALRIIKDLDLSSPKTAILSSQLEKMGIAKALFVSDIFAKNFQLASENIPLINRLNVAGLNTYDIIKHKQLILTQSALAAIQARLG